MGKGDNRRPTQISEEEFAARMALWQTPKPPKKHYTPPPLIGEQPTEPECSICRRQHPSDDRHPCE